MILKVLISLFTVTVVTGAVGFAAVSANNGGSGGGSGYAKDQCKNGGWEDKGYKNQGQCVSHFARGGS